jgi:hypothetical protein
MYHKITVPKTTALEHADSVLDCAAGSLIAAA